MEENNLLLQVQDLKVYFYNEEGQELKAVDGVVSTSGREKL